MQKFKYKIKCTQIVDELSNADDQHNLPAGRNGKGSWIMYHFVSTSTDRALNVFHEIVPLCCRDDFSIEVESCYPIGGIPEDFKAKPLRPAKRIDYHSIW